MSIATLVNENKTQINEYIITSSNGITMNINENNLWDDAMKTPETNALIQSLFGENFHKLETITIENVPINFADDTWDLSSLAEYDYQKSKYRIHFNNKKYTTNTYYEIVNKLFCIYHLITEGPHRPYIHKNVSSNVLFFDYLINKNYYDLKDIDFTIIEDYFLSKSYLSIVTINKYKASVKSILLFYEMLTNHHFENRIHEFLSETNKDIEKNVRTASKLSLLPFEFMQPLVKILYSQTANENLSHKKRYATGLLYLLTQTGIRTEEAYRLSTDCITKHEACGMKYYGLHYENTKAVYGKGSYSEETILNSEAKEIVNILQSLAKQDNIKYFGENIEAKTLSNTLREIVVLNAHKLKCITDKPDDRFNGVPEEIKVNGTIKYINIPITKQFRVYFSSELSRRGFSSFAIGKLLGHHDERMLGYYSRPAGDIQEDYEYSRKVMSDIVEYDTKVLGPKGDYYTKRIKTFIEEKQVKGVTSIDDLTEELLGQLPIREKHGGCCIKPDSIHSCDINDNTDEIYCAYGLCKNQSHFLYNAPYYYDKFIESQKIINYNIDNGFTNMAQKELFKLQSILRDKLLPELDEVAKTIEKEGRKAILERYPSLSSIVDNQKQIKEEIDIWLSKTIKN